MEQLKIHSPGKRFKLIVKPAQTSKPLFNIIETRLLHYSSTQSPQEVWNHRYAHKTMEFLELSRLIDRLVQHGITPVIPPKHNRTTRREIALVLYKGRNLVAQYFNKLKQFRAIVVRYDKQISIFFAAVQIALIIIGLG